MILPDRVFGRSRAKITVAGRASLPIDWATCSRRACSSSSVPSLSPLSDTKATIAWPVSSSLRAATAASATSACSTSALSTSKVERRCPDTLTTSSMRPISWMSPSASYLAPSPAKYASEYFDQ